MKGSKSRTGRDFQEVWTFFRRGIRARARNFHALIVAAAAMALTIHAQTPQFQIALLEHLLPPESFSIVSAMPRRNSLFSVCDEGLLSANWLKITNGITDGYEPLFVYGENHQQRRRVFPIAAQRTVESKRSRLRFDLRAVRVGGEES